MTLRPPFETDLVPGQLWPRLRLNFANGWTASVIMRGGTDALRAALACWPTVPHDAPMKTELGENEASPEEVAAYLAAVAARPTVADHG